MKSEIIIGLLLGWVAWRWFSGQGILPRLGNDETQMDTEPFDVETT